jgi:tRNA(Ile)-lysidine synthase
VPCPPLTSLCQFYLSYEVEVRKLAIVVYSSLLKKSIGDVRRSLEKAGLKQQDDRFKMHGQHEIAENAPLVLVACSGGRDSMALAAVAAIVCPTLGIRCGIVNVNHNLQEESALVSAQTVAWCKQLQLNPVMSVDVEVSHTRAGEEADARRARYDVLIQTAKKWHASAILLAHTSDDQAEGVLIGLIRSSGLKAVAGMREYSELEGIVFLRPFLSLQRAETTEMCKTLDVPWWDDPTNGGDIDLDQDLSTNFPLRSRVRHDLLPALTEFAGRNMTTQLARTAVLAREDQDFIDEQANRLLLSARQDSKPVRDNVVVSLNVNVLQSSHSVVRKHMWSILLDDLGLSVSSRHIHQIDELVLNWHGQSAVNLPSHYSVIRKRHVILVCKDSSYANC